MAPLVARPLTPAGRRLVRWMAPRGALLIAAAALPAAFPMHGTSAANLLAAGLAVAVLLAPLLALYLYARNVRVQVGGEMVAWTDLAGRTRSLERRRLREAVGHSMAVPGRASAAPLAVELRAHAVRLVLPEWLWSDEVLEKILAALDLPIRNLSHDLSTPIVRRRRSRPRIA